MTYAETIVAVTEEFPPHRKQPTAPETADAPWGCHIHTLDFRHPLLAQLRWARAELDGGNG